MSRASIRLSPVFAAAADYWFDVPVRRALVTSVVAALPVPRGSDGAYAAVRHAAGPVARDPRRRAADHRGAASLGGISPRVVERRSRSCVRPALA